MYLKKTMKIIMKEILFFEMYRKKQLNYERSELIIDNCTKYLNISSCLIKTLMKKK